MHPGAALPESEQPTMEPICIPLRRAQTCLSIGAQVLHLTAPTSCGEIMGIPGACATRAMLETRRVAQKQRSKADTSPNQYHCRKVHCAISREQQFTCFQIYLLPNLPASKLTCTHLPPASKLKARVRARLPLIWRLLSGAQRDCQET